MSLIPVAEFNEGQAEVGGLSLSFFDNAGAALAPSTAKYRIDCDSNNQVIRDWTNVTPADVMAIDMAAADTVIITDTNNEESRRVTVVLNEGLTTQFTEEFVYTIKNLKYFP